tara:strand:+ start:10790 stop:11740 length:951 start_codon:yes stop_codon:yes gene_type:complete
MSKLIDIKHPFQIKDVKSINEYLFILKNVLRRIDQKGAKEKPEGISIPVRWSNNFNDFVIDFGTDKQRDITGIHLENSSFYYSSDLESLNSINYVLNKIKNCSNIEKIAIQYKLKKNENRFLNFILSNKKVYFSGLYNRCQTKKRSGVYSADNKKSILIDNSSDFTNEIKKFFTFLEPTKKTFLELNYNSLYLKFLEKIEIAEYVLKNKNNIDSSIKLKDYIHKNLKNNKIKISDYINILNKTEIFNENYLFWFFIYDITLIYNNIILSHLSDKSIKGIVIHDNISDNLIKIVKSYKIDNFKKENILLEPILPVRF